MKSVMEASQKWKYKLAAGASRSGHFNMLRSPVRQVDASSVTLGVHWILFLQAHSPLTISECAKVQIFQYDELS
jgi:hypothetical protein